MPIQKSKIKRKYMFTDDIKFLQKVVVYHPNKDKFLVLKRTMNEPTRPNTWDLPGGNVLFGENHFSSLKREVAEETSLKIKNLKPLQVITNYEKKIYYLFIGYSCKAVSSKVITSKEHTEHKWITK